MEVCVCYVYLVFGYSPLHMCDGEDLLLVQRSFSLLFSLLIVKTQINKLKKKQFKVI